MYAHFCLFICCSIFYLLRKPLGPLGTCMVTSHTTCHAYLWYQYISSPIENLLVFTTCNDIFENFNCKIAPAFTILQKQKPYKISSVLIEYCRIFRAVVIDKSQSESEERLVAILPGACPASCRNSLVVSVTQLSDTVLQQK